MSDTEILQTVFKPEPCDFCPNSGLVYIDPETQGRYCLDCLVIAAEPLPELPPDPAVIAFAEEWIAARRAARSNAH